MTPLVRGSHHVARPTLDGSRDRSPRCSHEARGGVVESSRRSSRPFSVSYVLPRNRRWILRATTSREQTVALRRSHSWRSGRRTDNPRSARARLPRPTVAAPMQGPAITAPALRHQAPRERERAEGSRVARRSPSGAATPRRIRANDSLAVEGRSFVRAALGAAPRRTIDPRRMPGFVARRSGLSAPWAPPTCRDSGEPVHSGSKSTRPGISREGTATSRARSSSASWLAARSCCGVLNHASAVSSKEADLAQLCPQILAWRWRQSANVSNVLDSVAPFLRAGGRADPTRLPRGSRGR